MQQADGFILPIISLKKESDTGSNWLKLAEHMLVIDGSTKGIEICDLTVAILSK